MIIKKVNDGWYIGRHAGLTFFARTRYELYRKFWVHNYAINTDRLAEKLIELDAQYKASDLLNADDKKREQAYVQEK